MSPILGGMVKNAANILVKKVTTVEPDGEEVTKTKAREGVKGIGWIVGFLLVWHFILQPLLSYFFPQCAFPALDCGWLGTLLMGV